MAGTNDGNVQYIFGLGVAGSATAVNVTDSNTVLPNRPIQDVATDPNNPLIGYAAVGGFTANTPTTPGHILQVTCTAQCASFSWVDKSGNLPDIPANAVIANPNLPAQVFAGTDWGLYYTDDITADPPVWQRFEGLPHVMIWSLSIDRGFTTLAAFTRSRGAWAWPLPRPAGDTADLAVTMDSSLTPETGMQFNYTVTVTNNGPADATNVQLTSVLPAELVVVATSGDCATGFPCTLASIPAGESRTTTIGVCVPRDFSGSGSIIIPASATADTPDSNSANNSATLELPLIFSVFADGFDCPS